jgi:hypothetical protein
MGKTKGPGFACLFSGLNFQVIRRGAWSRASIVEKATQNGARNDFEGAKDAGEQEAGSTAASSLSPAAARSGCLQAQLRDICK